MADKHFIQNAIKKPGALHEDLNVPQGQKIPAKKLAAAAKQPGKVGQRARFAETLKGMHKAEAGAIVGMPSGEKLPEETVAATTPAVKVHGGSSGSMIRAGLMKMADGGVVAKADAKGEGGGRDQASPRQPKARMNADGSVTALDGNKDAGGRARGQGREPYTKRKDMTAGR